MPNNDSLFSYTVGDPVVGSSLGAGHCTAAVTDGLAHPPCRCDARACGIQANWLSYGGAERHPCIEDQLELNMWRSRKRDNKSCQILEKKGLDGAVWKVSSIGWRMEGHSLPSSWRSRSSAAPPSEGSRAAGRDTSLPLRAAKL